MILKQFIPYYLDMFGIQGCLTPPILAIGYQDCHNSKAWGHQHTSIMQKIRSIVGRQIRKRRGLIYRPVREIPIHFLNTLNLQDILKNYGYDEDDIQTLDFFDNRADIIHDMNYPTDQEFYRYFSTIIDFGTIEHVFDTKQYFWNLFKMLKNDGHLLLLTPCRGYFNHGLYTFSPECIIQTVEINGFETKYIKYSTPNGYEITDLTRVYDALIWWVGKKVEHKEDFVIPQQGRWSEYYLT